MNTSDLSKQLEDLRSAFQAGCRSASREGTLEDLFKTWLNETGHYTLAEYNCLLELENERDNLRERLRDAQEVYEKQLNVIKQWESK